MSLSYGEIARVAHEVNRAYCKSIGDNSQPAFDDAPVWQVESAIQGVKYYAENPGVTPEMMHGNWVTQKLNDGWTYGPLKNPMTKEHPCMVPYDKLPQEQKIKDHIFSAICRSLLSY